MVYMDSEPNPQIQPPDRATLRKLILVASIAAGVQFGWALQLALLTPYIQLLGLGHKWASLVWLCGPISGLVVQVIVGHHSDRCTSNYGRRRPFILGGAVSLTFGVLCIGFAADLGRYFGDSLAHGIRHRAATIFVVGFWLLDISNNIIQGPTRALLADISDGDDAMITIGNALFAFFMAVGNIMGYAVGASEWLHGYLPFTTTVACDMSCAHIKACFLVSILLMGCIVALVVVYINEEPLDPFYLDHIRESYDKEKVPSFFMQIVLAGKETSRPMWVLYAVTAFNWVGIFPFLLYDTDWMGKEVYGGNVTGNEEELNLYHLGVRAGSMGLALHVVTMGFVSLFLEPLIRMVGNVKRLWSVGNVMLAVCMGLTVVISAMAENARKSARLALGAVSLVPPPVGVKASCYGLFALFGFPQAITYSVPFALASIYSKDSNTGQGLALGLLNLAIVIPQMGVTLISGPLDSLFGGSNLPAFIWGGIAAAMGAFAALQLPDLVVLEVPRAMSRVLIP